MQLKQQESHGRFTDLFYQLTWNADWEQILAYASVLMDQVFGPAAGDEHPIKVELGAQAGDDPQDVTGQLIDAKGDLFAAPMAANPAGFLVVTGYAGNMDVDMRISFWTDTDQVLVQLRDDKAIAGSGNPNIYGRFMDCVEIWGHILTVKRSAQK